MFDFLEKIFMLENQLWKENAPGKMSELNDEKSVKDSEPVKKSRKPALPDFKNIDYKVMIFSGTTSAFQLIPVDKMLILALCSTKGFY